MTYSFEKKWYRNLLNKCNYMNSSLIYASSNGNSISLSDMYIQPSIVQDAVYGIGRVHTDTYTDEGDSRLRNYTVDDLLSSSRTNRHLIIGSLGNGKTSLLNHIVIQVGEYKLHGRATESKVVRAYKDKFVVFIALKDLIRDVKDRDFKGIDLEKWIVENLKKVVTRSEFALIDEHFPEISSNGVLLLVDGLDEIDVEDRKDLLNVLNAFCENPDNVVIATIRKEVLVNESWMSSLSGYQQITLADFKREQISEYIRNWKRLVTNCADNGTDTDLIVKVIFENRYLKELAANPLFLALMMLISEKEGKFPQNRTRIYEEAIKLILGRWNEESFESTSEISAIREALEQAAFSGMVHLMGQSKYSGDISAYIIDAFTQKFPEKKIVEYVKSVSEKTGIIIQNNDTKYSFALQSLMEYLAACYIAREIDVAEFIEANESKLVSWQEVIVFAVTKMAMERMGIAVAILYKLVKTDYQSKNKIDPERILITGIVAQELLCESNNSELLLFKERIQSWLRRYVCDKSIHYRLRFEIGNLLGRLGDDRPGVGIKRICNIEYPDIKWVLIPAGISEFGSPEGHINSVHSMNVDEFLISAFPITNEQFGLFVKNGYTIKEYWTDEGWAWVNGEDEKYFTNEIDGRYTEERRKQYELWLGSRHSDKRKEPFWWQDHPWNISNRPVVGITWYEAVAYCNWMNIECRQQLMSVLSAEDAKDALICLPTLEEWEKAARGPKCTRYPWGNSLDYKRVRANVDITGLNETCAVGIFAEGKSGYGVFDAAGNVYEWIATGVTQVELEKWCREKENLEGKYERLVKGGSWNMEYERSKAAYDEWDYPLIFDQNTGFRPIVRLKRGNYGSRTSEV